ncbi:unnamed protein product [Cochlearia groenlandica]
MSKTEKSTFVVFNSTITTNFGDRPPCTYSMKIQSVSQFKYLYADNGYKSRTFSSDKHKWRLVIYPDGNKKDNGNGFLSMYVELDTTNLPASTVLAYLTFFVYNKKENKYFTMQDVEVKHFCAIRPVWGVPQVRKLDTFYDPRNGYIYDGDQCEFGVDVMVPHTNWEVVSFAPKPSNPIFTWTVEKFSKLNRHCYLSQKLLFGGRKWVLELYPKGYSKTYWNFLSLFLVLDEGETLEAEEKIYTRADVRILDPFGCNHKTGKVNNYHCHKNISGLGWYEFVSLAKVKEAYLDKEGSLQIDIEFEALSTTKYSS